MSKCVIVRAPAITQSMLLATTSARSFSTVATARDDLLAALQKEHNEEIHEGGTEMGQEVKDLLEVVKKNGWQTIVDDGGLTKMHRNLDTMKIRVSFHCQDLVYDEEQEQENAAEEDQESPTEDEALGEPPGRLRFTVTATPIKTGKTLIFQCTSEVGTARIDAVSVGGGADEDIDKMHTEDAEYNEYVGPAFDELDEKLKEEFRRFLEIDVGIDSDMATFMNAYADYKEQQEYVKFLDECQKVLA
jgi:predicted house-cleaning noncanonical NTP pyrophosphatase (MazG superfamily)